ncbi:hypothetical protein K458DRAFT_414112 [Lentithecium fluviatile CBS 122367]|uniref:Uncharacterized protein n=1 Tax=Lentithecium fluviatile CBS 122367 TaxID=1168545 RepID=A0A6G1JCN9_9PLEO|nr:hypothetical protein K458DRAFT_414112 [Lentithecium fluviatile CBS 122367]
MCADSTDTKARALEEDWTGKTSSRERRKLQNRLHQRAWRTSPTPTLLPSFPPLFQGVRKKGTSLMQVRPGRRRAALNNNAVETTASSCIRVEDDTLTSAFEAAARAFLPEDTNERHASVEGARPNTHTQVAFPAPKPTAQKPPLIPPLLPYVKLDRPSCLPQPSPSFVHAPPIITLKFPLSPDHHLITLIQYNVFRAVMTNFILTGQLHTLREECSVIAALPMLHNPPATPPPTFAPTGLQMRVRHSQWIDSVPCPRLRDNLIMASAGTSASPTTSAGDEAGKRLDEDELCTDICGGIYEGFDDCAQKGLLVWGDPWVVANWEVSPGFARKWGWLLKGCGEMIGASNRWRESRGEEALVVEEV